MKEINDIMKREIYIWGFLRKTKVPEWMNGWIAVNLQGDPEEYIDIAQNIPPKVTIVIEELGDPEYYKQMIEFIKKCPDSVKVANIVEENAGMYSATKETFLQGEQIINQLISEINPDWTDIQKVAYVHYKMGKLISYFPEISKNGNYLGKRKELDLNCRSIWTALVKGKSHCMGISRIQRTILSRLGIETEVLTSATHDFLLAKTEKGNIITDATWDLNLTLYEALPNYFGVTYEKLLKMEKGKSNAHKLEEEPENVIEIPKEELKTLYKSIGIVNENNEFKCPLLRKCKDEFKDIEGKSTDEKIKWLFNIFCKDFSEETLHLSETKRMLSVFFTAFLKIPENKIQSKFVYSMEDKENANPQLIFYIEDENLKGRIFMLNQETVSFDEIEIHDLDKQYTIHEKDIEEGVVPFWKEIIERENNKENEPEQKREEK